MLKNGLEQQLIYTNKHEPLQVISYDKVLSIKNREIKVQLRVVELLSQHRAFWLYEISASAATRANHALSGLELRSMATTVAQSLTKINIIVGEE